MNDRRHLPWGQTSLLIRSRSVSWYRVEYLADDKTGNSSKVLFLSLFFCCIYADRSVGYTSFDIHHSFVFIISLNTTI